MICNEILGTLSDTAYGEKIVDYVDIEWHEAFKKLHKKISKGGREIGIRLDNDILTRGIKQDDVLFVEENVVIAVNIPPYEAIVITVTPDHKEMISKVCYEIGNKHASLFRGDDDYQFITPYTEPLLQLLQKLHGVTAEKKMAEFDYNKAVSSSVNAHTH